MSAYIYIYICMYVYIYVYIYMPTHTCMHAYINTCMLACIHTFQKSVFWNFQIFIIPGLLNSGTSRFPLFHKFWISVNLETTEILKSGNAGNTESKGSVQVHNKTRLKKYLLSSNPEPVFTLSPASGLL